MTKQIIPVRSLKADAIVKSAPDQPTKLLVLRAYYGGRKSLAGMMADKAVESFTAKERDSEVKNIDVTRLLIAPGVDNAWPSKYNDPQSPMFAPNDEMPKIYDGLMNCDAVLIIVDNECGFVNRYAVGMCERLASLATAVKRNEASFQKKHIALFSASRKPNPAALYILAGEFSSLGFNVAPFGLVTSYDAENTEAVIERVELLTSSLVSAVQGKLK